MSKDRSGSRARDGKAEEPLRFGPEREPQEDVSKGSRPNWKKASARKMWKSDGSEAECQGDAPPLPEQEEPTADSQEVEDPRGPDHPDPHGGPASRLRFDKESDTVKPEPDKAAAVIQDLDPEVRVKVVEDIATMDSAAPSAIKIIEAEMEKKFTTMMSATNVKVGGIDYVADVMNNLDRSSERAIFDRLERKDAELAEEIRKRMFVFEDIVTMDDRSVQRFLRECEQKDLVLALKGTTEEVAQKIFSNMSSRMAQSIRDDLEITTNVRVRDVEEAQQRIENVIRMLEEKNQLIIIKGKKDDIIA